MSTTFETKRKTLCECGAPLSHCDDVAAHGCAPEPGDFTVCVYCGVVFEFDKGGVARIATDDAIREFRELPEYAALVEAVHAFRESHHVTSPLRYSL